MADTMLSRIFPYGAPEVQSFYRSAMARGVLLSMLLHVAISSVLIPVLLSISADAIASVRIERRIINCFLPKLPDIQFVASSQKLRLQSIGIPVAMPNIENDTYDFTIPIEVAAWNSEIAEIAEADMAASEEKQSNEITPLVADEGESSHVCSFEEAPKIVKSVVPVYPELAKRAGLEGTVHIRVWLDKEGRVREALVQKSSAEIFNEPALAAARQMVFTPAVQGNQPVAVWLSIPIKFRLKAQ